MEAILSTPTQEMISRYFGQDSALVEHWHIAAGAGLQACVDRTVSDLAHTHPSFQFFEVEHDAKHVGFFGKELGNYLTTIFVIPEFRSSNHIQAFWKLLKSQFPETFYTAVYPKNIPAISFYSKNGEIIHRDSHSVQFQFKR